ncbi:UNVERIFIED_CONTAM: hypothetical protein Slati_0923700 [Sesamum latifolium]|uniref:Uncharacterized protein n=1 Tax=Sesamum latifolium TaxID=2727402 RepID=A0AAW2XP77_9LAMI
MRKQEKMERALEMWSYQKTVEHTTREWCDQGACTTGRLLQPPDHSCLFAIITATP